MFAGRNPTALARRLAVMVHSIWGAEPDSQWKRSIPITPARSPRIAKPFHTFSGNVLRRPSPDRVAGRRKVYLWRPGLHSVVPGALGVPCVLSDAQRKL